VKNRLFFIADYIGYQTVPIQQIVGSVGRYRDFDRSFLPPAGWGVFAADNCPDRRSANPNHGSHQPAGG